MSLSLLLYRQKVLISIAQWNMLCFLQWERVAQLSDGAWTGLRVWLRSEWGGWFVTEDMLFMNQHNCLFHFLEWAAHTDDTCTHYKDWKAGSFCRHWGWGGGVSLDLATVVQIDWCALCATVMLKRWSGKIMNSCGTQIWPRPSATACSGTRGQQNGQMAQDWTHTHTHLLFLFFFHADPQH